MDSVVAASSQLSSVSSTSSLESLASQTIAESDTPLDASVAVKPPQETPPTDRAETTTMNISSAVAALSTSRPKRPSPFQSFRSLRPSGPFRPLFRWSGCQFHFITAISFACLYSLHNAAATAVERSQRRRLEDEAEWTGEWNGEWTAMEDDNYDYECEENCDDDNKSSSMWIENDAEGLALSPDQIITYVSIGILSFMTVLCCVCYPEILVVTFGKLCGCCGGGAAAGGAGVSGGSGGVDEEDKDGNYVGGKQEKEKKKKKKRRKSRTRSSSRSSRSRRDVELV